MGELGRVLGHPLTLLLAGAALSGVLVPMVARGWQDQRKALEVKAGLVERISRAVMDLATAVQFALVGASSQTQEQYDAAFRTWQLEKAVLTSLLTAYFRDGEVLRAWTRCRAWDTAYYVQTAIRGADAATTRAMRAGYLARVAAHLAGNDPVDVSDDPRTGTGYDPAAGAELADPAALRARVDQSLAECVGAIVDSRLSLVGHRTRR